MIHRLLYPRLPFLISVLRGHPLVSYESLRGLSVGALGQSFVRLCTTTPFRTMPGTLTTPPFMGPAALAQLKARRVVLLQVF